MTISRGPEDLEVCRTARGGLSFERTRRALVDVELLGVKAGVGFDEDGFADHLLHLLKPAGAGGLELFDDLWVDPQHDVAALEVTLHLAHLDVDVVAYGDGRFDHAGSGADVAGGGERALERLLDALAGDGDEAKIVELKNLRWGAIVLQLVFEGGHDAVAVLALVHVDEVDDDDAAEIAEADLADDLGDGV